MADRKILFRSGARVDELSPIVDRARIAGVVSASILDLVAETSNSIQLKIGTSTKVTVVPEGRLETTSNASVAALRVGSYAGDPSTLQNGDIWYNSTTNTFRARQNGASVDLIGGAAVSGWTDIGTVVYLTTPSDSVAIGTLTMFGGEKVRVVGSIIADSSGQLYTAGPSGVGAYRIVYKNLAVNDTVSHADAGALSTSETVLGVAMNMAASGNQVRVDNHGVVVVEPGAAVSISAGQKIFLGVADQGKVTNVEPSGSGQVKLFLGVARTSNSGPGLTFNMVWCPRMPMLIP